jgi:hypothetical protein
MKGSLPLGEAAAKRRVRVARFVEIRDPHPALSQRERGFLAILDFCAKPIYWQTTEDRVQ